MARLRAFPLLLLACFAVLTLPGVALAQDDEAESITIVDASPRANAVIEEGTPDAVTITFSEPIAPEGSTVRVVGSDGADLRGTELAWNGPTGTLSLPDDLPHGSWLVVWDVAAADGPSEGAGFYGFTLGLGEDVAPLTIPDTGFDTPQGPAWLARIATAALLLGVLVQSAIWPIWSFLLRGRPSSEHIRSRLQALGILATTVAVAGAVGRLAAEVWDHPGETVPERLLFVLGDARPGWALLAIIVLTSLHSVMLALQPARPAGWLRVLPWLSSVALLAPVAVLSHAGDEPAGRMPALTVMTGALLALALLGGGVVIFAWLRIAVPQRFWLVVAIAGPVLLLAGVYLAWLFIGNATALQTTSYGTLAVVMAGTLVVFLIALGVVMVLARRSTWIVPALLAIVLTGLIGSLMTGETARGEVAQEGTQRVVPFLLGDARAQLILAPGAAGVNHVRLEVDRASLPNQTTAEMILAIPSHDAIGEQAVPLSRVGETAFEYHGNELVIADTWMIDVVLAEPNRTAIEASFTLDLDREVTDVDVPPTPWRFSDFAGTSGVVLVFLGIAGVVVGIAAGRSQLRMESGGMGAMALVLAAILLGQGRLDPILAVGGASGAIDPDDLTLITRGEEVYAVQCLSCHGAELRGDGPASAGLQPPPADFAAPHTRVHDESTLIYWLRNGKQGTAMPAFGDVLTDDDIRAVLSYIEREQREFTTPAP